MYLIYGIDLFVLKKSFMSEVFKIVQGEDNDYEEMWKKFEMKYGRFERFIDFIFLDI